MAITFTNRIASLNVVRLGLTMNVIYTNIYSLVCTCTHIEIDMHHTLEPHMYTYDEWLYFRTPHIACSSFTPKTWIWIDRLHTNLPNRCKQLMRLRLSVWMQADHYRAWYEWRYQRWWWSVTQISHNTHFFGNHLPLLLLRLLHFICQCVMLLNDI